MQCIRLKSTCRKCGYKVKGKHPEKCPECGEDMRCTRTAVSGYRLCPNHGGPVPSRGFYGTHNMKDGHSSQFPLTRLAAKYSQMQRNGRLLSNRAAVEVIDDRIVQLAERIDVDDAPDRLNQLYNLWEEYIGALDAGKTVDAVLKRKELDRVFEKAKTDYEAWNQMMMALDLRRKMVESEVKVLKEIKAIMTVEDAYHMLAKIQSVIMRLIDDPNKLRQVQYEFTRLIGEHGDNAGETTGGDDWGGGGEEGSAE